MPKVIEGVREKILETAKQLLFSGGYQSLSMRGVAKACGIATGTIYNYFENKDVLIASVMVQDWQIALVQMQEAVAGADSVQNGLDGMYAAIKRFVEIYESIWTQSRAAGETALTIERHGFLCRQISTIVEQLLCGNGYEHKKDFSQFLAENLLSSATRTDFLPQLREMVEIMFPPKGGSHE